MGGDALDPDIIWAAGFLDGEGHFKLYSRRSPAGVVGESPAIEASQTDPYPLHALAAIFQAGSVTPEKRKNRPPGARQTWRWRVFGQAARNVARDVYPHLKVKTPEAAVLFMGRKYPPGTALGDAIRARASKNRYREFEA